MKVRIKHASFKRLPVTTADGTLKELPVDQFSLQEFNINSYGWPKSDLTQLIEISSSATYDESRMNAFAQRIHMLKAEKPNNKSLEELIHDWRPSWIQTIAEEQSFAKWYNETYDKETTNNTEEVANPDESTSSQTNASES